MMKICFSLLFFASVTNAQNFQQVVSRQEYRVLKDLHKKPWVWEKLQKHHEYQNLLFLGDKPELEVKSHSIARMLKARRSFENIGLWSTDLLYKDRDFPLAPHYHQRHLNHRERFPFEDQRFDVVFGRRVLCHCETRQTMQTCGGLDVTDQDLLREFLQENIRVLSSHPFAFVFLHGLEPRDQRTKVVRKFWEAVLSSMQEHYKDMTFQQVLAPTKSQRRFGVYIGRSSIADSLLL